jgi:hypothetical protein
MRQVRQVGGVTVHVDTAGVVVWCDNWDELLRLALRGYTTVKPGRNGEVLWVAPPS